MSEQRTTLEKEHIIPGLVFKPQPVSLADALHGEIVTDTLRLEVYGHSEAGRSKKRSTNQDFFYLPIEQPNTIKSGSFLFAVADGVGSAASSEKASEIAVKQILQNYYSLAKHGVNHRQALTQAAQRAHQMVKAEEKRRRHTMATTFVAAMLPAQAGTAGQILVDFACIGDSRAYIWRAGQGQLEQITTDSLWYQDEQNKGGEHALYADTQIKANPRLAQSPRTIGGIVPDLMVDFFTEVPLYPNDIILLCSDGLYNPLGDLDGIAPLLQENPNDLNTAAMVLFNAVQRRGRLDDSTVVLVRLLEANGAGVAASSPPPVAAPRKLPVGVLTTLLLLLLLGVGVWSFSRNSIDSGQESAVSTNNNPAVTVVSPTEIEGQGAAVSLGAYPTDTPVVPTPDVRPPPLPTDTLPPTATATATPAPAVSISDDDEDNGNNVDDGAETTDGAANSEPSPDVSPAVSGDASASTAGDCRPGNCKYPAAPDLGQPAPNAVYDSPNPFEFSWQYISLNLNEYYNIRIFDSPTATEPVESIAVRDRNFIGVSLNLPCQQYYWSLRVASANRLTPIAGQPGLVTVEEYTGALSPESERRPFQWQVNCAAETPAAAE